MLFHSWPFLAFFLVVYPMFLLVKGTPLRLPWLLLISYVFYGWLNPAYLILIAWSTLVDWLSVEAMARTSRKGPWLALSLSNSLGLLLFFKYAGFIVENINALAKAMGLSAALARPDGSFLSDGLNAALHAIGLTYTAPQFNYLLPVGLSFYLFQSMTYTIGYYRGQSQREPNLLRYAVFVSLFPQLLSGPIERASHLLPQLRTSPRITPHDAADGLSLFTVGLFKKLALADALALYVNPVYASPGKYGAAALLLATVAFSWQIYFDFSGYSDMARGVARMFGVRLMLNFNNPYLATGLGDFWNRWHISLSSWFKDYLYVPLGGNRRGEVRTRINIAITMLVSGLWHGAMWTFVLWGAIHATARIVTRDLERTAFYRDRVPRFVKQLLTFAIVTLAWVFFKARSVEDALLIVGRIFTAGWTDPAFPLLLAALVFSIWLYQFLYESRFRQLLQPSPVRIALVVGMVWYLATMVTSNNQSFIYFQF